MLCSYGVFGTRLRVKTKEQLLAHATLDVKAPVPSPTPDNPRCCFWEHRHFEGRSICINSDWRDMRSDWWSDEISSAYIDPFCTATVWQDHFFTGRSAWLGPGPHNPIPNDLADRTTSIQCNCFKNCEVGSWAAWGACSVTCGAGQRTRTRSITQQKWRHGSDCPGLSESEQCDPGVCPVDCAVSNWSAWSTCSATCDGGSQTRSRSITRQPVGTGGSCPHLTEQQNCNTQLCVRNCVVSAWGEWSPAGTDYGTTNAAQQARVRARRARSITQNTVAGGGGCPALTETLNCELPCNWCWANQPATCLSCRVGWAHSPTTNTCQEVTTWPKCRFYSSVNPTLSTAPLFAATQNYPSLIPATHEQNARAARISHACTGVVYSNYNLLGNSLSLLPGSVVNFPSSFSMKSLTCECESCSAKCEDCKRGKPDVCTRCGPGYKTDVYPGDEADAVECYQGTQPECCFYDRSDKKNRRRCFRDQRVEWVGFDFNEEFKFAKVEAGCSATLYQYWAFGASGWAHTLNPGDNLDFADKTPRSLVCNCGNLPAAGVAPSVPAPNTWGKPVDASRAVPGFTRTGCFREPEDATGNGNSSRALDGTFTRRMGGPLRPDNWCAAYCFETGANFFGLQNTDECFCGSVAPPAALAALDAECGLECRGDPSITCGGTNRLVVYRITHAPNAQLARQLKESQASHPVYEYEPLTARSALPSGGAVGEAGDATALGLFTYLGCFFENPDGMPDLHENALELLDDSMRPHVCLENCKGFEYFAIRNTLCVCGRPVWKPRFGAADEGLCESCKADGGRKCGSNRQNSVYQLFV